MTQNYKSTVIKRIDKLLNDNRLLPQQQETLASFDKFNDLEHQRRFNTRISYLMTLSKLGFFLQKPFEHMTREDLQNFVSEQRRTYSEGTLNTLKTHVKRFFKYLEMVEHNRNCPDEEKLDIEDVSLPYSVRWIKQSRAVTDIPFEDLPTEKEVLKIVNCVETQRDRALLLTLWETGCSPHEILSLKMKSVVLNQYGGVIILPRFTDSKAKILNELKTEYRYRKVPIATSVPDLQLWMSMHPQKQDSNAPLWLSKQGGHLGYQQLRRIFIKAVKKAKIKKYLTLYRFRHMRLTQVADVLPSHELKQFAGHSKYSQVTPRYLHANAKQIQMKIYRERGVKIEEPEQKETQLTVKLCPRCKHKNSPTFNFCAMCSCPLDMKTMFAVQNKTKMLVNDMNLESRWNNWQVDVEDNSEYDELMKAVFTWIRNNPEQFSQFKEMLFQRVIAEMMKTD